VRPILGLSDTSFDLWLRDIRDRRSEPYVISFPLLIVPVDAICWDLRSTVATAVGVTTVGAPAEREGCSVGFQAASKTQICCGEARVSCSPDEDVAVHACREEKHSLWGECDSVDSTLVPSDDVEAGPSADVPDPCGLVERR
jgi:hypothetical protein